jgi:hypothetical protein
LCAESDISPGAPPDRDGGTAAPAFLEALQKPKEVAEAKRRGVEETQRKGKRRTARKGRKCARRPVELIEEDRSPPLALLQARLRASPAASPKSPPSAPSEAASTKGSFGFTVKLSS